SNVTGNHTQGTGKAAAGNMLLAAGVYNIGTLTITGSIIVGNSSDPAQGGVGLGAGVLNSGSGTATLSGTTVAQNNLAPVSGGGGVTPGGDVNGAFVSQGNNLIGDGSGASGFGAAGDRVGTAAAPVTPTPTTTTATTPDEQRQVLLAAMYQDLLGRQ